MKTLELARTTRQAITFTSSSYCNIYWFTEGNLLDLFVHYNSNSTLSHIKNATSFAVVNFVGHSFMDGTIYLMKKKNKQNHTIPYRITLEKVFYEKHIYCTCQLFKRKTAI